MWPPISGAVATKNICWPRIHLASLSSWSDIDSPLMGEVVEGGTRNILEAARAKDERPRVVFVSSVLAVNGADEPCVFDESAEWSLDDRKLSYSRAKCAAEALCQVLGEVQRRRSADVGPQ